MSRPAARRAPLADAGPLLLLLLVLAASASALYGYGADSVGGADSAGYLAQAHRWRAGALRQPLPFPDLPVEPVAPLQTPLGFRPSPDARATIPVYPPGWPLLLAAALTGGDTAAVRVLPAAATLAALVALFVLGRRVTSPWHAVGAVACVASAAPFLFQALQPMSDVPALAGWLMAFAGAASRTRWGRAIGATAAAVALAIRPNLAPLLLVVGWIAADGPVRGATPLPTSGPAASRPVVGNVWQVRGLGVLDLHRHEARYRLAATFVGEQRVPGLVVLAGQHSGAIAAYTDLPLLRSDLLTPERATQLLPWLAARGRSLAVVLDEDEARDLHDRLAGAGLALDWPPRARVGQPVRTRVWFLDDRAEVYRGGRVATVPLWPDRRR